MKFITPALHRAGWDDMQQIREEVAFTKGRSKVRGKRADYLLYYKPNVPIAVIEAKDNNDSVDVLDGVGHEGQRVAVVNDQSFVMEPGHLRLQVDEQAKFVIEGGLYNDAVHSEPLGGIYKDVDTCGEVYGPGRYGAGGGSIRLPRLKR